MKSIKEMREESDARKERVKKLSPELNDPNHLPKLIREDRELGDEMEDLAAALPDRRKK